jgi:predicted ABC-type ATPase
MPSLYIIAGPNGAGKTTFIKRFAPRELALLDFINADEIAHRCTGPQKGDRIIRINKMNRITRHEFRCSSLRTPFSATRPKCEPTKSCNPENPVNRVSSSAT